MKRKLVIVLSLISAVLVIVLIVVLATINVKKDTGPTPEYVFFYAENQTANYPTTLGADYFSELVYEKTGGRIKILVKYDAELGSESEVIKQMRYGGIAFARVSLSQLAEIIPDMNILQMPYLYSSSEHMWRVLDGEIGDEYLNKTESYGIKGLSWYDAGARNFYSIRPIRKLEDIEGMNIRVQESAMMADMVSALGAVPSKIVYSEVYSAIEQGMVDGAENNWPSYESMRHYIVAPYYTVDEHTRVPELQICSSAIWNQLSEEDKSIIADCARESALYERKLWAEREKSSRQIAEKSGITVIELSLEEKKRFRDAMTEVYVKYCGEQMDELERIMDY
ncbi:TRAP transporter substrate-binding protein [Butyrivibrio sp. YAB3001]|uniref:TRAP transporter substrate-binding protein n=1 Tax=Butyrivibrio sp. YAB3001 TaxID=1520812 RepID=UPI0008F62F79|nr:TRAP transporter substrate-binding protein [Butyrivibrio sp. YAB3001]SFB81843.1 tripartite ATP-independent transporter solute receptor, DctP family [Butyrivibrio sp. YAB3001]